MSVTWSEWIEENVYWKGVECIPRWKAIRRFIRLGLRPFLQRAGYVIRISDETLGSRIATGLYENRLVSTVESRWDFAWENIYARDEDKWHYYHVLDTDRWTTFWTQWAAWSDVSDTSWRGRDRQNDIQEYCWTQINLEESPQTRVVNQHMGVDEDSGVDERHGEDTYLREQAESGEWGGWRR